MKNESREERKERLREAAWKHAVDFGTFNQGKFFLLFEDGSCSEPLDSSNIPNEGWNGTVAQVNFENPYDWDDWGSYCESIGVNPNEATDEQEKTFIDAIKDNVPDRWDFEIEDEYEIDLPNEDDAHLDGLCGTLEFLKKIANETFYLCEIDEDDRPCLIYVDDYDMQIDPDGRKAVGCIRKVQ